MQLLAKQINKVARMEERKEREALKAKAKEEAAAKKAAKRARKAAKAARAARKSAGGPLDSQVSDEGGSATAELKKSRRPTAIKADADAILEEEDEEEEEDEGEEEDEEEEEVDSGSGSAADDDDPDAIVMIGSDSEEGSGTDGEGGKAGSATGVPPSRTPPGPPATRSALSSASTSHDADAAGDAAIGGNSAYELFLRSDTDRTRSRARSGSNPPVPRRVMQRTAAYGADSGEATSGTLPSESSGRPPLGPVLRRGRR